MEIVIYIYNGMTMLDAIGPYEILRNLRGVNIKFVAKKKEEITADSQFVHLNAKYEIDEIQKADILLIPGSTVSFVREMKDKRVLNWIKKINETTLKTVTVCTGSIILSATELLQGKKATSHWKPINMLSQFGAIPTRERIVEDGKFISSAGVSAGIDMALYLASILKGEKDAKAAQLIIEYDPKPMFQSGNYSTAESDIIEQAEKILKKDAIKNLSLWEMIKSYNVLKDMK
ncbi:DJ-1/PfpI family protein [uncultured Sunxiuqinia sp.]|uniref:DJ-1/PfpI family protein n=1 Tax=uncultured Sunxiuqinia sp. TaxID=1573825 RepID=UPI0030DD6E9C|tara:strand:- start:1575 stop:2270 length:696 start_codon:yes stop_codon:yes gene_type:complete